MSRRGERGPWARLRGPVIALLACGVVLAVVFRMMDRRATEADRTAPAFGTVRAGDVTSLSVRYLGDSMTAVKEDGRWFVLPDRFPADTGRIARSLGHLLNLRAFVHAGDVFEEAELAEYGLDSTGRKRVELRVPGRGILRADLGKLSGIDYGSVFWRFPDRPEVYRTPGKFVWDIPSRAMDWKDTNLYVRFSETDVRAVETEWFDPGGERHFFRVERAGDSGFVLAAPILASAAPITAPAGREAALRMFRGAAQFRIDGFVPAPDPHAPFAALDRPVMTVRVELRDGSRREVVVGAKVDRLYRYVRHPEHPDPVRVFQWRFDPFSRRPEDLVER